MTKAEEVVVVEQASGWWQWHSLAASISAFGRALDYDPEEHTYATLNKLNRYVTELEKRLAALELHESQAPLASATRVAQRG